MYLKITFIIDKSAGYLFLFFKPQDDKIACFVQLKTFNLPSQKTKNPSKSSSFWGWNQKIIVIHPRKNDLKD